MLASKIEKILSKIEKQEQYEQENPYEVPNSEKLLSIGRNTGNFYNILLKSKNAKKYLRLECLQDTLLCGLPRLYSGKKMAKS